MTGDLPARSATIRSRVPYPDAVAAAIAADDTDDIHTRVEAGAVVTDVERPTTASLQATVDDYVVALGVATEVASIDALPDGDDPAAGGATDAHSTDEQGGDYASGPDESDASSDDSAGSDTTDAHDTL